MYSDGGLGRKTDNLLVWKLYIALFLQYNCDKGLIARMAANDSDHNPVKEFTRLQT